MPSTPWTRTSGRPRSPWATNPWRRFLQIDLPLSLPVMFAGLRVVSVSNISLVSVAALLGIGNLGMLFTYGLQRDFVTEVVVGIIAILVLALLMDAVLVLLERLLTPWTRAAQGGQARSAPVSGRLRWPTPDVHAGAGAMSNVFTDTFAWLADPLHWTGSSGIPVRLAGAPAVQRAGPADRRRHRRPRRPLCRAHRPRPGGGRCRGRRAARPAHPWPADPLCPACRHRPDAAGLGARDPHGAAAPRRNLRRNLQRGPDTWWTPPAPWA